MFDELLDGALPAPQVFSDTLAPLVAQRRLLFTTLDGTAALAASQRTGLDGSLSSDATDLVAVTHSNTRVNKADAYLERIVDVDVQLDDATTAVRSTVTVTLTNNLPRGSARRGGRRRASATGSTSSTTASTCRSTRRGTSPA